MIAVSRRHYLVSGIYRDCKLISIVKHDESINIDLALSLETTQNIGSFRAMIGGILGAGPPGPRRQPVPRPQCRKCDHALPFRLRAKERSGNGSAARQPGRPETRVEMRSFWCPAGFLPASRLKRDGKEACPGLLWCRILLACGYSPIKTHPADAIRWSSHHNGVLPSECGRWRL